MTDPLSTLLLLLLFGRKDGAASPAASAPTPSPKGPHDDYGSKGGVTPAVYHPGKGGLQSKWIPYKPLTPEVIARAQALLADPTMHEVVEDDPSHPGQKVRYLRTADNPPGHTSVTAWRPRDPAAMHADPGVAV